MARSGWATCSRWAAACWAAGASSALPPVISGGFWWCSNA
jgi:hypothetical protein